MAQCDLKPKSLRQRARRLEQAALAKVTCSQDVLQFEADLLALLSTKPGERLLSEICAKMRVSRDSQQVIQNFKSIIDLMKPEKEGGTGKRKNSANTGAVASAFGAETSYAFLEDVLGIPRAQARRWRSDTKKMGKLPNFLTAQYPQGVTRDKMVLQLKAHLVKFFLSHSQSWHLQVGTGASSLRLLP
jgi:hypothetical protein